MAVKKPNYKTLLYNILYCRDTIDISHPVYVPFIKMIYEINRIINNITNQQQMDKIETVNLYKEHPFFHWIMRKEPFDMPCKLKLTNFDRQVTAIIKAKKKNFVLMYTAEDYEPTVTIVPTQWVIMGCPESTDIDIIILTDEKNFDTNFDISILKDKYGSKIDVNIGLLKDGIITRVKRGLACVTNNAVYHTYALHKQEHKLPIERTVELDIYRMIQVCIMCILNNHAYLMPNYDIFTKTNKELFGQLYNEKIDSALTILKNIIVSDTKEWKDAMKSIVMKLLQIYLYHNFTIEIYNKKDLARIAAVSSHYREKILNRDCLEWFLFRGTIGKYDDETLKALINEFEKILHIFIVLEWEPYTINPTNPIEGLDNDIFQEFLKNPVKATDKFDTLFSYYMYYKSFGDLFVVKNSCFDFLPKWLLPHVENIEQRSDKWIELMKFYSCGSLDSLTNLAFEDVYYNLFRGCVVEAMVSNSSMWNFRKFHVGMLVEEKREQALAVSPDLLLLNGDDIIFPVAIKCIQGNKFTSDFYRAVYIANRQLKRALDIIEKAHKEKIIRKALLILVYAKEDGLTAEYVWLTL